MPYKKFKLLELIKKKKEPGSLVYTTLIFIKNCRSDKRKKNEKKENLVHVKS